MQKKFSRIGAACLVLFLFAQPSYAYLDPGSASYTLQIILAALTGLAFFVKSSWTSLKARVSGRFSNRSVDETAGGQGREASDTPPLEDS